MNSKMITLLMSSFGLNEEDILQIGEVGKEVSQLPAKLNRIEAKLDAIISHLDIEYVDYEGSQYLEDDQNLLIEEDINNG